jgi:hypothetical protein
MFQPDLIFLLKRSQFMTSRPQAVEISNRWGHGDLNAGHKTPSLVGYQATLWPLAQFRMQGRHIRISH